MDARTLMLTDARFPGGGHAHSGGLEEAATRGLLAIEADLPSFLLGRLRTAGELAAIFAAAAAAEPAADAWSTLDAELDARTPSAAQRAASRAQGRALARAALALPEGGLQGAARNKGHLQVPGRNKGQLQALLAATPHPHHAIALGALLGTGGGSPADAALAAAYLSVSGPASASVRLLGLDPLRVNAIVWSLTPQLHAVAERATAHADRAPADLPAPGAPGLDLLAEAHHRKQVRLFAS